MFVSMRWKAIVLTSVLLLGLSSYFIMNSDRELKRLLESSREEVHLSHQNEIAGLLKQSYNHLLQLTDIIPILSGAEKVGAGSEDLAALIDRHWDYIGLNWGMESARLFDARGRLERSWGAKRLLDAGRVTQVLASGAPASRLHCERLCQQVVTLPVIAPSGEIKVLEVAISLADTLRSFQKITQADIGLLIPDNPSTEARYIAPWSRRLAAMTHLEVNLDKLKQGAKQIDFQALQTQSQVFQQQGEYYEISLVNLVAEDYGAAHFIIIEEVTRQHHQIASAKQADIQTALSAVVLSSLLVILALWSPVMRLRRQAELLPILAQGDFKLLREKLSKKKRWHLFNDEIDVLDEAEIRVADQLEQMQHKIAADTSRLQNLAHYDSLTRLANRHHIFKQIQASVKESLQCDRFFGLLYLDLDNFKRINDSLGHNTGDRLLQVVAKRLNTSVRSQDTVARLGGDEFCILVKKFRNRGDCEVIASNILSVLSEPIQLGNTEVIVSASIGIVTIPDDGVTTEQLLQNADIAMYRAKSEGRNHYRYYSPDMSAAATERMALETELRRAVAEEEFILHFQPQLDLRSNRIVGAEVLLRWLHPEKGIIPPDRFIPVLEETGLITRVGVWVIQQALLAASQWSKVCATDLNIAVNLSSRQFADPELPATIRNAMDRAGLKPSQVELEITETMVMKDIERSNKILSYLKALGVTVAVDDFGTGHSSLNYLKKLNLDVLKIDRSFVEDLPEDENDRAIVAAIIAMAHKLKLRVVAEGIESLEQEAFLKANGCQTGQGYLYSKPLSHDKFMELLMRPGNIIPFKPHKA